MVSLGGICLTICKEGFLLCPFADFRLFARFARFAQVYAWFTQGLRKVYAWFTHSLREVYAEFT